MRIISGKYRGISLIDFSLDTTKPTLDRVKESVCGSLQFLFSNSSVLDLFAGSGAYGIEALSRYASAVDFVDNNKDAIKIINKNLQKIKIPTDSVYHMDYMQFLKFALSNGKKYDIVFLDPPYNGLFKFDAVSFLIENNMIADGGVIISEDKFGSKNLEDYTGFSSKVKKIGTVNIQILRKTEDES